MNERPDGPSIRVDEIDAILFDLDGVVTRTASTHATAWKRLFDEYLAARAGGRPFEPFDIERDYRTYVDGKPRYEGVKSFLQSRAIDLRCGDPSDGPEQETVCGLGNRKNGYFLEHLKAHGVKVYDSSIDLVRRARTLGLKTAVVSSSANCVDVLEAARITDLFEARVDGAEAARLGLKGKPAPDFFLAAAKRLNVDPSRACVIEDAISGVEAGRKGGFRVVVGVDRTGYGEALRAAGADIVVGDLEEIAFAGKELASVGIGETAPSALDAVEEIERRIEGKRLAVFLDYDGTLTPIVGRPEQAILSEDVRALVRELAALCPVAVLSGRDRPNVQGLVGLDSLIYVGSHGFDIAGPRGSGLRHEVGKEHLSGLREAEEELRRRLSGIEGALVEGKKYAVTVHYRLVADEQIERVEEAVERVLSRHPELRRTGGKKIFELRPRVDWDKGKAALWLLDALGLKGLDALALYLGDDLTDEDAFEALKEQGIGILVAADARSTAARYRLHDPEQVKTFLRCLIAMLKKARR